MQGMTVRECYESFGGDYDEVLSRLRKEERIVKYAGRFAAGDEYGKILDALASGDPDALFRSVHNMKGVAANLGFTPLFLSSDVLCEALRPGSAPVAPEERERMLREVRDAYARVLSALKEAGLG